MTSTIDERKEKYYKVVLEKAKGVYASWGKSGVTSKGIAAQANAYAFDKRLKTDAAYRFRAVIFACALGMRMEKRYATFLQKLFRLFAFLRERKALALLKRVLGYHSNADMLEMIAAEIEKLAELLSKRNGQDTTGGGKRSVMGDLSLEEAMESFIEEATKEEAQKTDEKDLTADKAEGLETQGKQTAVKTEPMREQIAVKEFETAKDGGKTKQDPSKQQKTETLQKEDRAQKETQESGKDAKPTEKAVEIPSVFTEPMEIEQKQQEKIPSPFPIFRDNDGGKTVETQQDAFESQDEAQNFTNEKGEGVGADKEKVNSPFPVFNRENGTGGGPEKPMEKSDGKEDKTSEKSEEKTTEKPKEKETKTEGKDTQVDNNLSEENKARLALNDSLTDQERELIANHIQEMAKTMLAQEEAEWREKISITDNSVNTQMSEKVQTNAQGSAIIQNTKK
ncbi:MAG: hypothetical protein J6S04_05415 [Clostridia bacterium]|nr:hypothetical protein [Clostridia bacterium]